MITNYRETVSHSTDQSVGSIKTGAANVVQTFKVPNLGLGLILSKHSGTIPRNGFAWHNGVAVSYKGPEFMDIPGGLSSLAVFVSEKFQARLKKGARLNFSKIGS